MKRPNSIANRICTTYREILTSSRWRRAFSAGARPQRLPWASIGTEDSKASDFNYVCQVDQSQGQVKGSYVMCSPTCTWA